MKLFKLGSRGFAHHFLLALVVVGVAIGGTYYLVASKADTCGTSGASNPTSSATSCPVSGVSNPGPVTLATCVVNGIPASPSYGSTISPYVTVKNVSGKLLQNHAINYSLLVDGVSPVVGTANVDSLKPGASTSVKLASYVVPYATSNTGYAAYSVRSASSSLSYYCQSSFTLPKKPANTVLSAACTINNVPTTIANGGIIKSSITINNTGTQTFAPLSSTFVSGVTTSGTTLETITLASIGAKKSATHPLPAYKVNSLSNGKVTVSAIVDLTPSSAGQSKNVVYCSKTAAVTVPVIKGMAVTADEWATRKNATVVKDGTQGAVLKLSNSRTVSATANTSTNGVPMTELNKFVYADMGKTVNVCTTAKASVKGSRLNVQAALINSTQISKTFSLTKNYAKYCYTLKIPTDLVAKGAKSQISVSNLSPSKTDVSYVKTVDLTVK